MRARLSPLLPVPSRSGRGRRRGGHVDGVLGRFPLNGLGRVIAEGEGEGDCLTHSAVLCPTLLVRCRRECLLCRLRVGVGLPHSPSYEVVSKVITSAV